MIFVEGKQISQDSSLSQGYQLVLKLLQHPSLSSLTNEFKSLSMVNIVPSIGCESTHLEDSSSTKFVYVFQREYATVDPKLVQLVGTDEATTCVGLVIRNQKSGMTSVGHLDSVECVRLGLLQMLSAVLCGESDADLDVHLIGGYDDTWDGFSNTSFENDSSAISETHGRDITQLTHESAKKLVMDGYSWPLCSRIVESLQSMHYNFHVQTLCVLNNNTLTGPNGFACPVIRGFVVNTITGTIMPASFDRSARCPDEIVRRLRVSVSSGDPAWKGRLLETYDTHSDRFIIAPCKWTLAWNYYAVDLLQLSDSELLHQYSTSPYAESPDFVDTERRVFSYLLKNPNWKTTFTNGQPRIFTRTASGGWVNCEGNRGDE